MLRSVVSGRLRTTCVPAAYDARFAKLINASVRLKVDDEKGHSYGTGTIIDARQGEALIITCGHLFRESKGQGPLTVEMFEATPTGARSAGQTVGQVISYDLARDIALELFAQAGLWRRPAWPRRAWRFSGAIVWLTWAAATGKTRRRSRRESHRSTATKVRRTSKPAEHRWKDAAAAACLTRTAS